MVSSTPRPHFTAGKDPVPISQEVGCAPEPVWTGRKSRPHRDSIPDRPARSQSLYRPSYMSCWGILVSRRSIADIYAELRGSVTERTFWCLYRACLECQITRGHFHFHEMQFVVNVLTVWLKYTQRLGGFLSSLSIPA